jgi:hypothetical protein
MSHSNGPYHCLASAGPKYLAPDGTGDCDESSGDCEGRTLGGYQGPTASAALGESVHAAGTVYGGTKLVVSALWALRGFNRPTDIDKQTRLIAKGAHRAVGNGPVYYK